MEDVHDLPLAARQGIQVRLLLHDGRRRSVVC
jgi:hypothetical protein